MEYDGTSTPLLKILYLPTTSHYFQALGLMYAKKNIKIRNERCVCWSENEMSAKETKVMRINSRRQDSIKISVSEIEDTEEFTYLGSTVTKDGGAEADIRNRLSKARNFFNTIFMEKCGNLNHTVGRRSSAYSKAMHCLFYCGG